MPCLTYSTPATGISPDAFLGGGLPGIGDVFLLTAVDAVVYVFGEEIGTELLEPCPVREDPPR